MRTCNVVKAEFKVLLVEDSPELQRRLCAMLEEIPNVKVVAIVDTEQTALDTLNSTSADLAIVDLELKAGTGLGFLKTLGKQNLAKAVVFSNYSNLVIRHRCTSLGALAFFDKSFQIEDLLQFVQTQASN